MRTLFASIVVSFDLKAFEYCLPYSEVGAAKLDNIPRNLEDYLT